MSAACGRADRAEPVSTAASSANPPRASEPAAVATSANRASANTESEPLRTETRGAEAPLISDEPANAKMDLASATESPTAPSERPSPKQRVGSGAMGRAAGGGAQSPVMRNSPVLPPSPDDEVAPVAKSAAMPLRARLDPNARYATTYRPGGAMLAAFDAAVARGALPAAYRDLVADFGGRYAPTIDGPHGRALTFRVETERAVVPPAGGFMHLRVAMRSSDESPGRSPLSVHLVLDVSGSMSGTPIDNAKRAAQKLVDRLESNDMVSITIFSDSAHVIVPAGAVGPRRALVQTRIRAIEANGGTNISAGLDLGYAQARRSPDAENATKIVMLLSDGMANAGDTSVESIARRSASALSDAIQTSTFGLGDSFDASVMSTVADRGAGGYYYLKDSSQIAGALSSELDARLQPVAQAVEVRVRLKPDVAPVRVYGSRELREGEAHAVRAQELAVDENVAKKSGIAANRKEDVEGGMRFFMPAFARADRHAMLVELELPPGVGERSLGSVEIRYKDLLLKKNVTEEIAVHTTYAASDADSAQTTNASVVATMQAFSAGDAILRASELAAAGSRERASAMLRERGELLRRAAKSLAEPRLAEDATRVIKLASIVSGETTIDPVPLAILLRGSAYGYLR
jgi:Ca-activated chloride channel family protein